MTSIKKCGEIFWRFFVLGCISFGGPIAHIGYFQKVFVEKLGWVNEDAYAKLIALSHFLPGPGSSQIGFAIGLQRAGIFGGITAFLGFTIPSFLLMFWLAISINLDNSPSWVTSVTHGLKLLAAVVVLDALINMAKSFCTTKLSVSITILSTCSLFIYNTFYVQVTVLLVAATVCMMLRRNTAKLTAQTLKQSSSVHWLPISLFLALLILSFFITPNQQLAYLFSSFYQTGSLVFGGGHVVLPLLQTNVGDALTNEQFLFGYAIAQSVPGPMFSIASFLGAELMSSTPLIGALLATLAIFLPGFLLVLAVNGSWQSLMANPYFSHASQGINAAVVGLLANAFYHPVLTSALTNYVDLTLIIIGLISLRIFKAHVFWLIGAFILLGLSGGTQPLL